jgi:hypothetical protein
VTVIFNIAHHLDIKTYSIIIVIIIVTHYYQKPLDFAYIQHDSKTISIFGIIVKTYTHENL